MCASQNAKAWSLEGWGRAGASGGRRIESLTGAASDGPLAHPKLAGLVGGRDDEHAAPQLDRELAEERDEHRAVPLLAVRARRREDRHLEDGVGRVHLDDRRGDRLAVWCVQDDLPPVRELCAQATASSPISTSRSALRSGPLVSAPPRENVKWSEPGTGCEAPESALPATPRRVPLAPLRRGRLLALHLPRIVHADAGLLHLADRGAVRPLERPAPSNRRRHRRQRRGARRWRGIAGRALRGGRRRAWRLRGDRANPSGRITTPHLQAGRRAAAPRGPAPTHAAVAINARPDRHACRTCPHSPRARAHHDPDATHATFYTPTRLPRPAPRPRAPRLPPQNAPIRPPFTRALPTTDRQTLQQRRCDNGPQREAGVPCGRSSRCSA